MHAYQDVLGNKLTMEGFDESRFLLTEALQRSKSCDGDHKWTPTNARAAGTFAGRLVFCLLICVARSTGRGMTELGGGLGLGYALGLGPWVGGAF